MRALTTPQFTLEPQTTAHAQALFAVLKDPALYRYEGEPPPSLTWLTDRLQRLESRQSADGSQQWLNWVIRLPDQSIAGFVQATVRADSSAYIAYVLGSAFWGRGLARRAVAAMLQELCDAYAVRTFWAVLKTDNTRSAHLLGALEFQQAPRHLHAQHDVDATETLMRRDLQNG